MHTFGNRRDIDGLRALAVIPVVLFHFGIGPFSGGFVGVDVFFVISGFLITGILYREISAGRFSFVDFWARRARRILPALSVVLLATLALGWLLFTDKDFSELGRTVRYQSLFISNILFMHEDGYFQPASELKPLLHTWSLAVEEQYYVFFPLLMAVMMRHIRHWRWMLFAVLLVSFGLNIFYIERKSDFAFFSLPTRAWELLCGAMLAVLPASRKLKPWVYQVTGIAGLAAVLLAVFTFDRTTVFPGWSAVLPVLGAAALIWSAAQGPTWTGRLLSTRILVWVGLLSYSLYLWHWPVYVYANAISSNGIQPMQAAGWMLLSLVLAWLSLRFIELPFREKRLFDGPTSVLTAGLLAMGIFAVVGSVVRSADGFPQRLTGKELAYAQARLWRAGQLECMYVTSDKMLDRACLLGEKPGVPASRMVWGDSHAAALMPAIKIAATREGRPVWLYSMSACPPILSDDPRQRCKDFNERTMEQVRRLQIKDVVLAGNWTLYVYGREDGDRTVLLNQYDNTPQAEARMERALKARVKQIREAGAQVWLFKEVPQQRKGTVSRLTSLARIGRSTEALGRPTSEYLGREGFLNELFDAMSEADPGVHVIDPIPMMCGTDICNVEIDHQSLYKDDGHLSDVGGARLSPLFIPMLRNRAEN
uniref:Acyltransferase n=1 Tax=Pseudomonas graminis TaxID=158627 RepID=A0A7C1WUB9_9PSED